MSYTYWNIKNQDMKSISRLSAALGCSEIVSRLLLNRGICEPDRAEKFLYPDDSFEYDPFLLSDMELAVSRIESAIKNHEKICIYGDYDVDGITSVSTLYLYLKNFTRFVDYYIPDRFTQGYGMNIDAVKKIKENGCSLIITVDTGISAFDEAKSARSLGIDMIITDHHECQNDLPDVYAVINPKRDDSVYPFRYLAGVGVVYKLISAMDISFNTHFRRANIDLVAIGTIADIMPLVDENRKIVKDGLDKISKAPNTGLKKLVDICMNTSSVSSANVGFAIAPRINAAGRMENAETGVKLFITNSEEEAQSVAEHLCELNTERQVIENKIYDEAIDIIEKYELDDKCSVLVLWKENWHNGVIGIVASKLKDKYNKPVILFSADSLAKGSARSPAPFNIFEAFAYMKDILIQYGGHKYAAGALIARDKLHEFRDRICAYFDSCEEVNLASNRIDIECELPSDRLNIKTLSEISLLQPFGKLNEVPLFCIRNVRLAGIFPTSGNKHLRLKFNIDGKSITGFYFNVTPDEFDYRDGDLVDILCELNENKYKNIKSIQLVIRDLRLGENQLACYLDKRNFCEDSDEFLPSMLPSRSDIAIVYKYLYKNHLKGKNIFNIDTIANIICKDCLVSMNYEKVYLSVKILDELEIISSEISDEFLIVNSIYDDKKVSLCDSALLMSVYKKAGVKFGN